MAVMKGFQVWLRGGIFLAVGSIFSAERQLDNPGLPLECGCAGRGVGVLSRPWSEI